MNLNGIILFKYIKFLKKETKFWNPILLQENIKISKKRVKIFLEKSQEAFFYYDKCNNLELIRITEKTNINILSLLNWSLLQSAWLQARITGDWNKSYYITEKCSIENISEYESIIKPFNFIKTTLERVGKQRTNNIKYITENLEITYPEYTKILKKITKITLNIKKDNYEKLDTKNAIAHAILIIGIFSTPCIIVFIIQKL